MVMEASEQVMPLGQLVFGLHRVKLLVVWRTWPIKYSGGGGRWAMLMLISMAIETTKSATLMSILFFLNTYY
jgi:hypothetical protein